MGMDGLEPGEGMSVARMREIAAQAVDPCVTSSMVVAAFWEEARGSSIDPKAGYDAIQDEVEAVRDGGMAGAKATLVGHDYGGLAGGGAGRNTGVAACRYRETDDAGFFRRLP